MSDVLALVNAAPPTVAPRQFHTLLCNLRLQDVDAVISRTLHANRTVNNAGVTFSAAVWQDVTLCFYPSPFAMNRHITLSVAVHPDDRLPTAADEVRELGSCVVHSGGAAGSVPTIFKFPVDFDTNFLSPLIRPAPLQKRRAAISMTFNVADCNDEVAEAEVDTPLVSVYLKATVLFSGAS